MKVLSISDKVSPQLLENPEFVKRCSEVELVLSCGDVPPEFLSSLRNRYDVPLFYVLGNHDIRYGGSPPQGCQCIDRRIVTFNGYSVVGFSGSRWYNGGKNQYTEKEMARNISRMRFPLWRSGTPDIVISHAPPRHVHDAEDLCHRGFKSYNRFIEKYRPPFFIHGHIHRLFKDDLERITVVSSTQVINTYGFYFFEI